MVPSTKSLMSILTTQVFGEWVTLIPSIRASLAREFPDMA